MNNKSTNCVSFVALLWLSAAVGCIGGEPEPEPGVCDGVDFSAAEVSVYVVDSIHFPSKAAEATQLSLNIDGDSNGRHDNAFGQIYAAVVGSAGDIDLDASTRELIEAGEIIHLLELRTAPGDELDCTQVRVLHGLDVDGDPTDNFSGNETFAIDSSRGEGVMVGIDGVRLVDVSRGTAPIAVTFFGDDEPVVLDLGAAAIKGELTERGFEGVLGGGIHDVDTELIPLLHRGVVRAVEGDCVGGVCVRDSLGEYMLGLFDTMPEDGAISYEEFSESNLVRSLFTPDVDILDADGQPCLLCDGKKESLSVGIGFTAVPAAVQ